MKKQSLTSLLAKIDEDERGMVSLETILIIGAIALPILIFVIKVGWPMIEKYFTQGVTDLQTGATAAEQGKLAARRARHGGHRFAVGVGRGRVDHGPPLAQDLQLDDLQRNRGGLRPPAPAVGPCWPPAA